MTVLLIILIVVVLIVLYVAYRFNRLIRLRTRTQEAWSDIDVELKRRYDLIPNLVNTVQGYAAHERGVFEAVTAARTNALAASKSGDPSAMAGAEDALTGSTRQLLAVAENYPQLKASELFLNLQEQLTTTEDKVEFSRRFYNGNVRDFNTALQTFPTNIYGQIMHFQPFAFFQVADAERVAPTVSFTPSAPTVAPPAAAPPPPPGAPPV
jgi:LemA protein